MLESADQFELQLTTATNVVAIFVVVEEIFGMNFEIDFFEQPGAFKWVLTSLWRSYIFGISLFLQTLRAHAFVRNCPRI
ncbi:hypothetical protein Bca101_009777 [Brassica carinata]